jgi:protein phosphatase 2C family protein 2/3
VLDNKDIPLELCNLDLDFPEYETSKCSNKQVGIIKSYAVNTYQGLIRNYNEDRVAIILNIAKPADFKGNWPRCSFFGVYDGHGGYRCADYLRDFLHMFIIKDSNFPENPELALRNGFLLAEKEFINTIALDDKQNLIEKSGSCAVVAFFVEDTCYIANLGDSRAVLSYKNGKINQVLSNDHKPGNENENERIIKNGGRIYQ